SASASAAPAPAPAPSPKPAAPPVDAALVQIVPAAALHDAGVAAAPASGATEVVASIFHACAVTGDGRALCWGSKHDSPTPLAIAGKVKTLRLSQEGGCALVDDGTVQCFKWDAAPVAQVG